MEILGFLLLAYIVIAHWIFLEAMVTLYMATYPKWNWNLKWMAAMILYTIIVLIACMLWGPISLVLGIIKVFKLKRK